MPKVVPETDKHLHLGANPSALNLAVGRRETAKDRGLAVWAATGRAGFDEGANPRVERIAGDVRSGKRAGPNIALNAGSAPIKSRVP